MHKKQYSSKKETGKRGNLAVKVGPKESRDTLHSLSGRYGLKLHRNIKC
jgi:hypothetical protein